MDQTDSLTLEIRLHGRGGQGGVTCAKILASLYASLGKSVQSFGDYAGERSGAPVRAYTRVSDQPVTNRNKVYEPHHLLVLDPTLMNDAVVAGLREGGTLLINTTEPLAAFEGRFETFQLALVDATSIARRHHIGSRSVVIVNTTIGGAYARALGLSLDVLEAAYQKLGLQSNVEAAREAYAAVAVREPSKTGVVAPAAAPPRVEVEPLVTHTESPPTQLRTGNWRTQTPRYTENLAPCSAFCPAGNDVVGFVRAVAADGVATAASVLGRTTPLAGVCGRVCAAPCMEGCNRREYDGSVNIRGLERYIADHARVAVASVERAPDARRFAIVGGGPAGLGAAYEIARQGHRATIFDGEQSLGGLLRTGIPDYRLPRAVLDAEVDALLELGIDTRLGVFLDGAALRDLHGSHDAVIVATGMQRMRGLEAPGVELEGIEQGLGFLHRVNIEGREPVTGHVVVLGGGNTAMDCARTALRLGAERVTIAYRRGPREMPAITEEVEQAIEEGVIFELLRQPVGFFGAGKVDGVILAAVELGEADDSGRRRPVVTDRTTRLACDRVLLALGQSPDLRLLPSGWRLEGARIHEGERALPVYVAGDLVTGDGTVTHAIGDGRRAATQALADLGLGIAVFERPDRTSSVPFTDIRLDHFAAAAPAREIHVPAAERLASRAEVSAGLADGLEAHRCFSCGHCTRCDTCLVYCPEGIIRREDLGYEVDYSYCKGCGICVTECPRSAIEMRAS